MTSIARIALTGLLVVTLPATALMAHGQRGSRMSFEQIDSNGDGSVTQAELAAHADARFARLDANGDGLLQRDELSEAGRVRAQQRLERMMSKLDQDGDGAISQSELSARRPGVATMFERLDRDDSGTLSKEEFADARKMRHGGNKSAGTD